MTDKNPTARQDAKPVDGSSEKEHSPNRATPARERISFDDLYWFLESQRINAQAWVDVHANDAKAGGGEAAVAAWRTWRRRLAMVDRLQAFVNRAGGSDLIKLELARLAKLENKEGVSDVDLGQLPTLDAPPPQAADEVEAAECD